MVNVIGVRFRSNGKVYYFDPGKLEIEKGQNVIVETVRGVEYGMVSFGNKKISDQDINAPLKPVIRLATPEDDKRNTENRKKEKEAFVICQQKIKDHGLDMKLLDTEYTFDNNKVLFYFTADGRVDFRELVKDLASVFRTRIELRQIGVRDETKLCGGVGVCGRTLCCCSYLSDFSPVSIKMAKDQNLSLNPTKISGICGRLMCCLKNEEETYTYLNSRLPNMNDIVTVPGGDKGKVTGMNVLRQTVKVAVDLGNDEIEEKEFPASELKFKSRGRKDSKVTREELEALKGLEDNA
ncbi:MAG: stage 0 sporulation family protein [Lachnospiraceae bacterium]|nr:stage 0 sporulation family protein [Lachnospiraceae bacterium]